MIWKIKDILGKFCVCASIFCGAMFFVIQGRWLYQLILRFENLHTMVPLSDKEILKNYDVLMQYMNNPFIHELKLPDFPSSASGLHHFEEVKQLFFVDEVFFIFTVIPAILFLLHLQRENKWWKMLRISQVMMVFPLVLTGCTLLNFDGVFITFHKIFFRNNDWLYDPATDPIIKVLPESYFLVCFVVFLVIVELLFLMIYLRGKRSFHTWIVKGSFP